MLRVKILTYQNFDNDLVPHEYAKCGNDDLFRILFLVLESTTMDTNSYIKYVRKFT